MSVKTTVHKKEPSCKSFFTMTLLGRSRYGHKTQGILHHYTQNNKKKEQLIYPIHTGFLLFPCRGIRNRSCYFQEGVSTRT